MSNKRGRPSRRSEIVIAAERLLAERGLNGMTTRAIAEAVPCSEGAIYVHFKDRLSLILEVLQDSLPEMLIPLHGLLKRVGTATPEQNLITAMSGLMRFHRRVTPMLCSLMAEPELLHRFRHSLAHTGKGPNRGIATLAKYIEQEQELGRIDSEVNAKAAATTLMASSFFHQFTARLFGPTEMFEPTRLVEHALRTSGGARPKPKIRDSGNRAMTLPGFRHD